MCRALQYGLEYQIDETASDFDLVRLVKST